MRFRVLGPLTVSTGDQDLKVGSARVRSVLARLLIQAPHPVTAAALIEELWRDKPPASAANTLQTYISQLRQLIEPDRRLGHDPQVLRSLPGAYLLSVQAQQLDSWLFEEALRDGKAALDRDEPDKAAQRLGEGLALWRGPAFADVDGLTAEREAARLEEQRLLALDLRIQADLALGRHAEIIGELEQLVAEHPWREQFVAHSMVALYRCQRQADALAVYRRTYDCLSTEVGVRPGSALQDLHQRILRQDPALELPAPGGREFVGAAPPSMPSPPARATKTAAGPTPHRFARRRLLVGAAVVLSAMLAGGAVLVALGVPPWQRFPDGVHNEFDLDVPPRTAYDFDISPGDRPPGRALRSQPGLDFYRTSSSVNQGGQISGVSLTHDNEKDFNAIHLINPTAGTEACRDLPTNIGGNVALRSLHRGAKVCLRTHDHRWALVTVTGMPSTSEALLSVHVTVLTG
jgi:DNA-binding SARP family transcriptional activator